MNEKREDLIDRTHEIYMDSDHWKVVDIEKVDNVFVTDTSTSHHSDLVRIDIDGIVENDEGDIEEGANINTSIWLNKEMAKDLWMNLRLRMIEHLDDIDSEEELEDNINEVKKK